MVSATGDWTAETLEVEYPAVRAIYELFGAADRVQRRSHRPPSTTTTRTAAKRCTPGWRAGCRTRRRRQRIPERSFTPEPVSSLLVFHQQPLPANAVDVSGLTDEWIAAAKRQLRNGDDTVAFNAGIAARAGVCE